MGYEGRSLPLKRLKIPTNVTGASELEPSWAPAVVVQDGSAPRKLNGA
jgi:hypothetical protein